MNLFKIFKSREKDNSHCAIIHPGSTHNEWNNGVATALSDLPYGDKPILIPVKIEE